MFIMNYVFLIAPALVLAIMAIAAGGAQAASGAAKKGKAKRMARENIRPDYEIPKEIIDNLQLSESRANTGLSSIANTALRETNESAYANAVSEILKGGGNTGDIAGAQQNFYAQQNKAILADEQARINNFNQMLQMRREVAGYRDKEWQVDKYGPYVDKAAAAAQLANVGEQQIWQGVGTATQGISGLVTSGQVSKDTNNINTGKSVAANNNMNAGKSTLASNTRSKSELAQQINWDDITPQDRQLLIDLINT